MSDSQQNRERLIIKINEGCITHLDEEHELEEQILLRLPKDTGTKIHSALISDELNERLSIKIERNLRDAEVKFDELTLQGEVVDLPCIIESYKTFDNTTIHKTANISQMLLCSKKSSGESNKQNKTEWAHGVTPPLRNVRKVRFRKVQKQDLFEPEIEPELMRLFQADSKAKSVRFEIEYEEVNNNEIVDALNVTSEHGAIGISEVDLFGEMMSSSSSADESNCDVTESVQENETDEKNSEFSVQYNEETDSNPSFRGNESDFERSNECVIQSTEETDYSLSFPHSVKVPSSSKIVRPRGRGRPRRNNIQPVISHANLQCKLGPPVEAVKRRGRPPLRARVRGGRFFTQTFNVSGTKIEKL